MEILEDAARKGDEALLVTALQENPDLLHDIALTHGEGPLHISSKIGHYNFIRFVLVLKPSLARELNKNGFSPMHLAAANGHEEAVNELLKVGHDLCHIKDRDGWTPLHRATCKARINVINLLLSASPECVLKLTHQGETCLHLAVKKNQCHVLGILVEWLEKLKQEELVNSADNDGNTILHLATSSKQYQTLELLLCSNRHIGRILQKNITNIAGFTALDLYYQSSSESAGQDKEIGEMLHGAGAIRAKNLSSARLLAPINVKGLQVISVSCLKLVHCSMETRNMMLALLLPILIVALQAVSGPSSDCFPQYLGNNYHEGFEYYNIRDVLLLGSRKHSQVFYSMTALSAVFMVSMSLTPFLLWSLPLRMPIIFIILSLVIYYCFGMARTLPHFVVVCGSFHISSYWFVWLGVITLICIAFVAINILNFLVRYTRGLSKKSTCWLCRTTRSKNLCPNC